MGVTIRDTNNFPKLQNALKELGAKDLQVGIFGDDDAEMVKIARAHEYGVTITPKNSKFLTVPLPIARGTSAGDYDDLFRPKGTSVLARPNGDDDFTPYFILMKSVTIPERSFIRAGYDAHVDEVYKKINNLKNDVLQLNIDTQTFLDAIGLEFQGKIQQYITNLSSPGNAGLTKENKGSSNPLIDEGNLLGSITWKVR